MKEITCPKCGQTIMASLKPGETMKCQHCGAKLLCRKKNPQEAKSTPTTREHSKTSFSKTEKQSDDFEGETKMGQAKATQNNSVSAVKNAVLVSIIGIIWCIVAGSIVYIGAQYLVQQYALIYWIAGITLLFPGIILGVYRASHHVLGYSNEYLFGHFDKKSDWGIIPVAIIQAGVFSLTIGLFMKELPLMFGIAIGGILGVVQTIIRNMPRGYRKYIAIGLSDIIIGGIASGIVGGFPKVVFGGAGGGIIGGIEILISRESSSDGTVNIFPLWIAAWLAGIMSVSTNRGYEDAIVGSSIVLLIAVVFNTFVPFIVQFIRKIISFLSSPLLILSCERIKLLESKELFPEKTPEKTPEEESGALVPASLGRRYLARGFDILLLIFLLILPFIPSVPKMLEWAMESGVTIRRFSPLATGGIIIAFLFAGLLSFIEALLLSTWGTTPGKWLFNMIVRDAKGEKLSFDEALDRSSSMWKKSTDISSWEHEGSYVLVRRESEILHVFVVIAGIICCVVAMRGKDPIRQYALINRLENEEMSVRLEAARTLGEIGSFWAVAPLIDTLTDESSDVREATAQALGAIGDNRSVEPLIVVFEDKELNVRRAAAHALDALNWSADRKSEKALYLVAKQEWDECVKLGQPAVEPLIAVLTDKNSDVREAAAYALGAIGESQAVEPLIALLEDEASNVRKAATNALDKIGQPAIESLIATLANENSGLREAITHTLGVIGQPAVEPLIATFADGNLDVRRATTQALNVIGQPAIESLIVALADRNPNIQWAAAQALDTLGWSTNSESEKALYFVAKREWDECVKLGQPAIEPLIAALVHPNHSVQIAAAQALDTLGWSASNEKEKALYFIAKREWDECVKLGKFAVDPLIAALKDEKQDVQIAAAQALGEIGDNQAVEPLIAALKDEKQDVQIAAAQALDILGWSASSEKEKALDFVAKREWDECVKLGESAVDPLIAALKDEEQDVQIAAAQALGEIRDNRAIEPLIAVLANDYSTVTEAAIKALAKLGEPAIEPLITALKDKDWHVRVPAIHALSLIGDNRAVEPLIAILKNKDLKDEDRFSRNAAAYALGEIGDNRAVKPLIATLTDEYSDTRAAAAYALGEIGDSQAIKPLRKSLKDRDQRVQKIAKEALDKIEKK